MAAPISLVCTWQFHSPSPPTTTIESPIAPQCSLNSRIRSSGEFEEVHHLVALLAHVEFAGDVRVAVSDEVERRADGAGRCRRRARRPAAVRRRRRGAPSRAAAGTRRRRRRRRRRLSAPGAARACCRAPACRRRVPRGRLRRATRRRQRRPWRLGALAADREDRALDRLQHGVVGARGRGLAAPRRTWRPGRRRAPSPCRRSRA